MSAHHPTRLTCDQISWKIDQDLLQFETTDDIQPSTSVLGQQSARDALLFGIQCEARDQNVYVRGDRGTGRIRMVEQLLAELQPTTEKKCDYCYVHNFSKPQNPRSRR